MKNTRIKGKYLAISLLVILMSASCGRLNHNLILEVSDLSSGGTYCYQGIEWGSSTDDVAEEINSSLGKTVKGYETPSGIYADVRDVQMYGTDGVEVYGFKNRGLEYVRVTFGDMNDTSHLNNFLDQLLSDLKKEYGPAEEQLLGKAYLHTGIWGRSSYYQWKAVGEDGTKSLLQLNLIQDTDENTVSAQLYLENIPEV